MPQRQIIDGDLFALKSAEIDLGGTTYYGISSLNPKQELPLGEEFGSGVLGVGLVTGPYKGSADIEILLHEYGEFVESLALFGGYGSTSFNIGATYVEVNGPGILDIQIVGARIASDDFSNTNDGKASRVKFSVKYITPLLINGVQIYSSDQLSVGGVVTAIGNLFG